MIFSLLECCLFNERKVYSSINSGDGMAVFARFVFLLLTLTCSLSAMQKASQKEPVQETPPPPPPPKPAPLKQEMCSHFYFGPKAANLELQIRHNPHLAFPYADDRLTLDGPVAGAEIDYEYKKFRALYIGLYGSWVQGKITKDHFPSLKVNDVEAEGKFGYNYMGMQGRKVVVTPYFGVGYNYTSQEREAPHEVTFKYNSIYLPTGFILDYHWTSWFMVSFNFKWMPQVYSKLKISSLPGKEFDLKKQSGQFLVELPLMFRLGCKKVWDITLTPYWERKKNGVSPRISEGVPLGLPKQSYTYGGAILTLGYTF